MARLPVVSRAMVPEKFGEAFDELTAATGGTISGGNGLFTNLAGRVLVSDDTGEVKVVS